MNIDITRLNNDIEKSIPIDFVYSFSKDELSGTDLISLDNIKIKGELLKNSIGNIELSCTTSGIMVLPCAITLEPVNYPFKINISGEVEELLENFEENDKNFKNTIDILPIIWENILMEIPMRVVSDKVKDQDIDLSGDGWSFTTKEEESSSPLGELLDIISDSEVR